MVYSTCSSQVGPGRAGRRFKGTVRCSCGAAPVAGAWHDGVWYTTWSRKTATMDGRWNTHHRCMRHSWQDTAQRGWETRTRGGVRRQHANNRWWWIGGELLSRDSCLSAPPHYLHYFILLNVQNRGVSWLGHSFAPPPLCLFMLHREQTDWNWRRRSDGGAE